jgi:hypothetical protein
MSQELQVVLLLGLQACMTLSLSPSLSLPAFPLPLSLPRLATVVSESDGRPPPGVWTIVGVRI